MGTAVSEPIGKTFHVSDDFASQHEDQSAKGRTGVCVAKFDHGLVLTFKGDGMMVKGSFPGGAIGVIPYRFLEQEKEVGSG